MSIMSIIRLASAEACANAIVVIVLIQMRLSAFGVALTLAWKLNVCGMCLSYARSFILRLLFARRPR